MKNEIKQELIENYPLKDPFQNFKNLYTKREEFLNLEYSERRQILRQDYLRNADHHKAIKTLAYKVQKHLTNPRIPELSDLQIIIKFLVDGFLAYEIIRNNHGFSSRFIELDPITLVKESRSDEHGEIYEWVLFKDDKLNERAISDKNIHYFSYANANALMDISFSQSLYTGSINYSDEKFIKKHYKEIVSKLT